MKTLEVFTLTFVVIFSSNVLIILGGSRVFFQGHYLPGLYINYVAISKDLNNDHHSFINKDEIFYDQCCDDIGAS